MTFVPASPIAFHQTQEPITGDDWAPALGATSIGMGVAYSTKLHNTESNQAGKFYEEYAPSLQADSPPPAVAYPLAMRGRDDGAELEMGEEGIYNALRAGDGGSSRQNLVAYNPYRTLEKDGSITSGFAARPIVDALHGPTGNKEPLIADAMAVRRLMPIECERLQGFPDGWTAGETDSARYRLLGNAVCVPVAEWIGRRIMEAVAGPGHVVDVPVSASEPNPPKAGR